MGLLTWDGNTEGLTKVELSITDTITYVWYKIAKYTSTIDTSEIAIMNYIGKTITAISSDGENIESATIEEDDIIVLMSNDNNIVDCISLGMMVIIVTPTGIGKTIEGLGVAFPESGIYFLTLTLGAENIFVQSAEIIGYSSTVTLDLSKLPNWSEISYGEHTIGVITRVPGYPDSQMVSIPFIKYIPLSTPVVSVSDFTMNWGAIENATSYEVYIAMDGSYYLYTTVTEPTCTLNAGYDTTVGDYTFAVKAKGNPYPDSEYSNDVTLTIIKLDTPIATISGNVISWEVITNATLYEIFTVIDGVYTSVGTTEDVSYDVT